MTLTLGGRQTLRRVLPIVAMGAALLLVAGFVYFSAIKSAGAAKPSDYGLKEGDTISAVGSNDPDVYIVNDWGYKRLFLNPVIFSFYGHLGGFAKVKNVSPATRNAFPTSGLFRNCQTNDQKVYGVETTGEDTGIFHWVNTSGAQAVADDPNFFKKVFCINSNEFNWYSKGPNYTSVNQVPSYARVPGQTPTPTPVAGNVTVSLASDNPGASNITTKASGVTYLKLNLSGTGTVSSIKVYRKGPGASGDFANVYIYDGARRLTSGRTPSSSDGSVTFSNLNVAVSGSKVLSIVADHVSGGATTGNVNYFAVVNSSDVVLSSGTVGGSFPLNGSNFTVTGQAGGTITLAKVGSISDPNVGASNAQLSSFKLTTNTEGARLYRVQMINGGTVKSTDITNLHVDVNSVKVADGYMTNDGYAVFDFGSNPFFIAKGDNRVFNVYGSVNGKKADTIKLYFESNTDLLAIGDQFGFGVQPDITLMDTSAEAFSLTLQGGVLTLTFVGPTASTIGTSTSKTHFLDFDVNSAANVELRKHTIVLCRDNGGNGTYDANSDTTNGWNDVDNVSIIDRDSGVTLVGPQNSSAFTTSNSSCPGGVAGAAKQFTDTFNLTAGQTMHLAVVGDVKTANTGSGVNISSGDIIKAIIDGYGDNVGTSGDLTIARYTNTNTALTSTDIVPAGDISGNNLTVQTSSLQLSLGAAPTGTLRYVKGTQNISAAAYSFSTALGNQVTVTNLTLTGYALDRGTSSTSAGTMQKGCDAAPDTAVCVGTMVSHIRLVDSSTGQIIASDPSTGGNSLSNTTGTAVFNGLNWVIPGGSTKTLLVKTDLSTNATSGSKDWFSFDIVATTDVTAVDANSNTINAGNAAVNGTNPTTYVVVNNVGTLTSALAPDSPIQAAVYWGQVDAPYSKFRFTSTNEAFPIERLNLYTADKTASLTQNIDSVKISYTTKDGSTLTATQTFNNAGSTSFAFNPPSSGQTDTRPYVPKDGSLDVTVTATLKTAAQQFRAVTNANFVSIDLSAINADEFRAVGEGSGNVVDATGITTTAGNNMYMYRSFPRFTYLGDTATTIVAGQDVFKFSIDALGLASDGATVLFDSTAGGVSGSLKFAILASGDSTPSASLGFDLRRVVDTSGLAVNQLVATRSLNVKNATNAADAGFNNNSNLAASISINFGEGGSNNPTSTVEIPAGKSSTFVLRLNSVAGFAKAVNTNTGRTPDYLQIFLRDNEAVLIRWTDKGGLDRNNSNNSTTKVLTNLPMNGRRVNFQ